MSNNVNVFAKKLFGDSSSAGVDVSGFIEERVIVSRVFLGVTFFFSVLTAGFFFFVSVFELMKQI